MQLELCMRQAYQAYQRARDRPLPAQPTQAPRAPVPFELTLPSDRQVAIFVNSGVVFSRAARFFTAGMANRWPWWQLGNIFSLSATTTENFRLRRPTGWSLPGQCCISAVLRRKLLSFLFYKFLSRREMGVKVDGGPWDSTANKVAT